MLSLRMKMKSKDMLLVLKNGKTWKPYQTKDGSYRVYWNKDKDKQRSIDALDIELLLGFVVSGGQVRFMPTAGSLENPAIVPCLQEDVILNGISIKEVCKRRLTTFAPPDAEIRQRGKEVLDWVLKKQIAQTESEEDLSNLNSFAHPTDKEIISTQRLEQNAFRKKLLKKWNRKCIVTGIDVENVLRASHIKAYSECDRDEKYDINNGLLLSANIDALFDRHLISFDEDGKLLVSKKLTLEQREALGIAGSICIRFSNKQLYYMNFHRTIFLSQEAS